MSSLPKTYPIQHQEMAPEEALVLAELERITRSPAFAGSARLKRLLSFLVEETLAGRAKSLRGTEIATRFFERGDRFDSSEDPIVRVEVSKLRRALTRCYESATDSTLRIEIPVGSYVPHFVPLQPAPATPSQPACDPRRAWLLGGPTVIVRPFVCRGDDAAALVLAQCLPEQLAVMISRIPFVHAIASSVDAVAEGYILQGSVTCTPGALKVTLSLSEADGRIVGGETYLSVSAKCQELAEIARVQFFDFASGVLNRTENLKLRRSCSGTPTAYEAVLQFRRWLLNFNPSDLAEAQAAAAGVLQTHPEMVLLLAPISIMYGLSGWTSAWPMASRGLAHDFARRAAMADPLVVAPHLALAFVYMDASEGVPMRQAAERAAAIGTMPGLAGFLLAISGDWERGTAMLRRHLEIVSFAPGWYHHALFLDAFRRGDYPAAFDQAQLIDIPELAWGPLDRAAVLGKMGEVQAAQETVQELLAILPPFADDPRGHLRRLVPDRALVEDLLGGLAIGGVVAG